MASRSRKRDREEHLNLSPNHQDVQAQPSELKGENPQQLSPKPGSTPPKDPEIKKKEKRSEGAEMNKPNAEHSQLCAKPASTPPKDTDRRRKRKKKSVPKREGAEINDVDAEHLELCPKLDPLHHKESDPPLLPEPEPAPAKEADQKKKKRRPRKKNKGMLNGEGVESNKPNDEHPQLCHQAKPTTPKGPDPELLSEPELAAPKEPDQKKKKRRRKKKTRSVLNDEGVESNRPNAENPRLLFKFDPLPPKDSHHALLPEPQPAKKKDNSVLNGEGIESNRPNAEFPQLVSQCDPLPPIEPEQILKTKKKKEKSALDGEGAKKKQKSALNGERVGLTVQKKPLKSREHYLRCLVCRQLGHSGKNCPRVKNLTKNQEICFFCGNVGHTLGKCPTSPEGPGAKFANGLLCNGEHLRKNCPQNSQGIHPKVVPANEPIKTGKYL